MQGLAIEPDLPKLVIGVDQVDRCAEIELPVGYIGHQSKQIMFILLNWLDLNPFAKKLYWNIQTGAYFIMNII